MQYRSKCEAKLSVVVTGNTVTVQRNFEHTEQHHVYETTARLSVSVIRSIEVAVHSDVRQTVSAILRNVSTDEAPIEVQQNDRVRQVVNRAREEEMVRRSPVERGFVPNGDLGTLKKFARKPSPH
jgi:dUTPase